MAGSVKTHELSLIEDFFAGVDELRTHLDRRLQDPARRRTRLGAVALDLLKARDARELCRWLVSEVADAIGASAAVVFVREGGGESFIPWHAVGVPPGGGPPPSYEDVARHSENALRSPTVDTSWVPLKGLEGVAGALWFVTRTPLDPASVQLLEAIADTAGVALEQSLLLQAMS